MQIDITQLILFSFSYKENINLLYKHFSQLSQIAHNFHNPYPRKGNVTHSITLSIFL